MRKFALPLLLAVVAIGFIYWRTLASVEQFVELAPAPSQEAESSPSTETEQAPSAAPASGRTPVSLPPPEEARSEPKEAPAPAATITGIIRDPHGQPRRAYVRYVWNDRGRFRDANVWSGKDGRFVLALPQSDTVGDLLASVYKHEWSPAAQIGVVAGSKDLELTLGFPAFFEVEFRTRDGAVLPAPWTRYYWELAGYRIEDYPGPSGAESLRWAVSPVPIWISAQPQSARGEWHGPFEPRDLGARLVLEVERLPVVRGRVLQGGTGVEGAKVELEPLTDEFSETRGVAFSPRGPSTSTDAEGRFEITVGSAGWHGPVAFHHTYGSGRAPAVELDGEHGLDGIEIALGSAPGALHGRVILPQGRCPTDIWLTVSGGSGYRTSRADGSFILPDLEPGPCRISVTDSYDIAGEDEWVRMTHGPGPPDWLPQEFTFEAEVLPGESREVDLDLSSQPSCRLQGTVSIGTRFKGARARGYGSDSPYPRLLLDHGNPWEPDAAVTLDHEGRFLVGVNAPGSRRLFLELRFPELDLQWEVADTVELVTGSREWNLNLAQGALRLLPPDLEHPIWSGPVLDWHGAGDQTIRVLYSLSEEADGSVLYRHVPAGTVTFSLERAGTKRTYSCAIRAGETTELRLAE